MQVLLFGWGVCAPEKCHGTLYFQCLDLHLGVVLGSRMDMTFTGKLTWKIVQLSVGVRSAGPGLLVADVGLSVPNVPLHRFLVPHFLLIMEIQQSQS